MDLRIAIAQLDYTVGAFVANLEAIRQAAQVARAASVDLLVLTELATIGYPPRDLVRRSEVVQRNLAQLEAIAALAIDGLGIITGYLEPSFDAEGRNLFNAAALCDEGRVVGRVRKCLLPTYDVFDEDRYFEPGGPVRPLPFRGIKLGVTICEDIWNEPSVLPRARYHRDPVDELAAAGVDVFVNISASPFGLGKDEVRRRLVRAKAIQHRRPFVYANQVGANDELVFDGHSLVFDAEGNTVARASDFAEEILLVDVPESAMAGGPMPTGDLAEVADCPEEEARRALVLGVRDYLHKSGFSRVVIGLSGGIDSALVAAIATEALGPENVLGIAMPSRYSSEGSVTDARELAENLGMGFEIVPIEKIYASYLQTLEPVFSGAAPDVTEENIQARIRGAILMAVSNKSGRLLLTTGNKSELAVGYCTLYGDMCGGLAVISDLPKTLVYSLARHIGGPEGPIPMSTITKPPSAELAPDQKDSDSLPPYDLLDAILEGLVERAAPIDEVADETGAPRELVVEIARKVDRNEFKRRQAAPGLKVTAKAFGSGRRYPIVAAWNELDR